jgi:hypothetical protein
MAPGGHPFTGKPFLPLWGSLEAILSDKRPSTYYFFAFNTENDPATLSIIKVPNLES